MKRSAGLRRRFNDIDRDKVLFWLCVALFAVALAIQ